MVGHSSQVRLDDLPGFGTPAVSRYAATTPTLLQWFDAYNADKPYREQVRPFGFLLNFQRDPLAAVPSPDTSSDTDEYAASRRNAPRPVATFDQDPAVAAVRCFDRLTGDPVPQEALKTYRQALNQYHLHPETKFANGDYLDAGPTVRRHIRAVSIEHIGKEANRWEEQLYLGNDPEAQIGYGTDPENEGQLIEIVRQAADRFGQRVLAATANVSVREVGAILRCERRAGQATLVKLAKAIATSEATERERLDHARAVLAAVRTQCRQTSLRQVAAQAGVDAANLSHVLSGRTNASRAMIAKLEAAMIQST